MDVFDLGGPLRWDRPGKRAHSRRCSRWPRPVLELRTRNRQHFKPASRSSASRLRSSHSARVAAAMSPHNTAPASPRLAWTRFHPKRGAGSAGRSHHPLRLGIRADDSSPRLGSRHRHPAMIANAVSAWIGEVKCEVISAGLTAAGLYQSTFGYRRHPMATARSSSRSEACGLRPLRGSPLGVSPILRAGTPGGR